MRILQLVTARQFRGAEVFASVLSESLESGGDTICFCGLYPPPDVPLTPRVSIVKDLVTVGRNPLTIIRKLVTLINSYNPDVIQCNGSDTLKYAVAARFFARQRTPLIYRNISLISNWIDTPLKKMVYKYLFRKVTIIASVSELTRNDFMRLTGLTEKNVTVVKRAIAIPEDPDKPAARARLASTFQLPGNAKILICVGSLHEEKNHDGLLRIFQKIANSVDPVFLFVVGSGPLETKLKQYAHTLGLMEKVFFVGFTSSPEMYYQCADLLLLPSHVEGISGAVLEAASYKTPSVTYNVGGLPEAISDHVSGRLIEYGREDEYANEVVRLLKHPGIVESMGSHAYNYVKTFHNKDEITAKFRDIYKAAAVDGRVAKNR